MSYEPKPYELYWPYQGTSKSIEYEMKSTLDVKGNFNVRAKNGKIITVTPARLLAAVGELWVANA